MHFIYRVDKDYHVLFHILLKGHLSLSSTATVGAEQVREGRSQQKLPLPTAPRQVHL